MLAVVEVVLVIIVELAEVEVGAAEEVIGVRVELEAFSAISAAVKVPVMFVRVNRAEKASIGAARVELRDSNLMKLGERIWKVEFWISKFSNPQKRVISNSTGSNTCKKEG